MKGFRWTGGSVCESVWCVCVWSLTLVVIGGPRSTGHRPLIDIKGDPSVDNSPSLRLSDVGVETNILMRRDHVVWCVSPPVSP